MIDDIGDIAAYYNDNPAQEDVRLEKHQLEYDLTWRYFHDQQRLNGRAPGDIASEMTALLKSKEVLLRIGLARGWEEHPDRCYIQLTGVYTFPDYLEGKTFADFTPKEK